eukprot:jgi/Chrzof1/6470/Cz18g12080.t1
MRRPSYAGLRMSVSSSGDMVALQPMLENGAAKADTLSVDLKTGGVQVSDQPVLSKQATGILAVIGVFKFKAAAVIAVVTEAQQVATLYGQPVFRVTKTQIIKPNVTFDAGQQRLLTYLEDAFNPQGTGRNLFFSYGVDLTHTAQHLHDLKAAAASGKAVAWQPDQQFFWNRTLARLLIDVGADAFVIPLILGSVGQWSDIDATAHGKSVKMDITLIARKSVDRSGTRHWRRGADTSGAAANFVETEQIVSLDGGRVLGSYVQVRGSIPLLWTQIPNIKYKPPTKIMEGGDSVKAFDAHADRLLSKYMAVTAINLVNQHGSEGQLERAFRKESKRYAAERQAPWHYVAFDFHKECGAANYGRLAVLWEAVKADFYKYRMFLQVDGNVESRQSGVFRVNCIDCLDRTNVLQGVLGRKAMEEVLMRMGVLAAGDILPTALPAVETEFKIIWANHGDDISRQYAGTGALKSGFTRTGKRSVGGLIDDGVKSMARYYLNNFKV